MNRYNVASFAVAYKISTMNTIIIQMENEIIIAIYEKQVKK